jgi:hypothetical protein
MICLRGGGARCGPRAAGQSGSMRGFTYQTCYEARAERIILGIRAMRTLGQGPTRRGATWEPRIKLGEVNYLNSEDDIRIFLGVEEKR